MDTKGVDPRLSAHVARRVHILLAQGARHEFREQARAFERERLASYDTWARRVVTAAQNLVVTIVYLVQIICIVAAIGYLVIAHCSTRHQTVAQRNHCNAEWVEHFVGPGWTHALCAQFNFIVSGTGVWFDLFSALFVSMDCCMTKVHMCDVLNVI